MVLLLLLTASRILDAPSRKLRMFDPPAFTFTPFKGDQKAEYDADDDYYVSDRFAGMEKNNDNTGRSWHYDGRRIRLEAPPPPLPGSFGRLPRGSRGGC